MLSCFSPHLGRAEHCRLAAALVAVTDLLTWKVLRREQGLSESEYRRCVEEMLEALRARRVASVPRSPVEEGATMSGPKSASRILAYTSPAWGHLSPMGRNDRPRCRCSPLLGHRRSR